LDWLLSSLEKLRSRRPLVHNITNFVVMNTSANALLALGASPIMAHSPEEIEDLVRIADAIVINIGTLDNEWIYSMFKAVDYAKMYGKPVLLDPVGAGATRLRTRTAIMMLEKGGISIVRGNYGELSALLGVEGVTKGVDSAFYDRVKAVDLVYNVAKRYNVVAAVSGYVDYVSDGSKIYAVEPRVGDDHVVNKIIHRVTGLGCLVSAIMAAFLAVEDAVKAAVDGFALFKAVTIKAAEESPYPGSFHVKIYDWLYRVDRDIVLENVVVKEVEPQRVD